MRLGFDASSNGQNDTPHVRFVSVIFSVSLRLENTSEDARLPQISPAINITIKKYSTAEQTCRINMQ